MHFAGSFNPVHTMHVALLDAAKNALENKHHKVGFRDTYDAFEQVVLAAFLAPSNDEYVSVKLGPEAMRLSHRNRMCQLATADSAYIDVCNWGWASGRKTVDQIVAILQAKWPALLSHLQGFEICGADFALRLQKHLAHGGDGSSGHECVVCLARAGSTESLLEAMEKAWPQHRNRNFVWIQEPGLAVSSTQIRCTLRAEQRSEWLSLVRSGMLVQPVLDHLLWHWDRRLFQKSVKNVHASASETEHKFEA